MDIPLLYLDTCIILDIVRRRQPSSIFLANLIKAGDYRVIFSGAVLEEALRVLLREAREKFPHLLIEIGRIRDIMYEPGFRPVMPTAEVYSEALRIIEFLGRQNVYDALHIAYSFVYKVDYLITEDRHILHAANRVRSMYGVKIIEPFLLVPVIYDSLEEVRGQKILQWPPCIEKANTKMAERPKLFSERLVAANFFRSCLGYEKEEMHVVLSSAPDYNRQVSDRILESYPPCVIFCREIKRNMEHLCPYRTEENYCNTAMPLEEDLKKEKRERRLVKTAPSPFYDYIRKARHSRSKKRRRDFSQTS